MPREMVASELLRPGLLDGVSVLVGASGDDYAATGGDGAAAAPFAAAVAAACTQLGAEVRTCHTGVTGAYEDADAASGAPLASTIAQGTLDVAVVDAASLFDAGEVALGACLEATWELTRAVANEAFIADGRGGRIIYVAPRPGAAAHAEAARAGLENLARTLSVEWARHSITVVTVAPGGATTAGEVAVLCAYLASPAGAYFSGCRLEMGGLG